MTVMALRIEDFRIADVSARPVEFISGVDPVDFPPPDKLLQPLGSVDDNHFIYVAWHDIYQDCHEAIVAVEATR